MLGYRTLQEAGPGAAGLEREGRGVLPIHTKYSQLHMWPVIVDLEVLSIFNTIHTYIGITPTTALNRLCMKRKKMKWLLVISNTLKLTTMTICHHLKHQEKSLYYLNNCYACMYVHVYPPTHVPCPEPLCPCYSALISKILPSLVGHGSTVQGHQHILTAVPLVWKMELYIKQQTGTHTY